MALTRDQRRTHLNDYDPALAAADLAGIVEGATKTVRIAATNAVALGLSDVHSVVAILAYVTATGAPVAPKSLLAVTTDYTIAGGDITPVGNHSAETWVIHYRI